MEFTVKTGLPEKQRAQCIVVGVFEGRRLSPSAQKIDDSSDGTISQILRKGDCEGKVGQALLMHNIPGSIPERVLLVGCGKEGECTEIAFKEIISKANYTLRDTGAGDVISCLIEIPVKNQDHIWKVRQLVLLSNAFHYRFDEFKSQKEPALRALRSCAIMLPGRKEVKTAERAIVEAQAISEGIKTTKDLGITPPNICTPTYLATKAKQLAKKYSKISTAILEEKELAALGMGSFLSVAQGSNTPPKLITMEYRGARKDVKPIVLVGKGITFDTGGNSLKSGPKMITMKYDMCGAATLFGVLQAAAELELPLNVIGVIPSCENMPGPSASRPDDVVKSMSGLTIEILNTDAEGRLILADALTYCERFNPEVVIDVATLTGAIIIALGFHATGLMANDQALADDLIKAGNTIGDRAWQLPIWDEYAETLKSDVGDVTNISTADVGGGSVIAACFLSKFTQKFRWAHLDIAGTAQIPGGPKKGPTGRPVSLLVQYLLDKCE